MAKARMIGLTSDEQIQAIKLYNPDARDFEVVNDKTIKCSIDGKYYEVEAYVSWDAIKFNGLSQGLFDGGRANVFSR